MLGFFFRKSELWLEMFVPRQVRQFFVVDVLVVQEHVFEGGHFLSWPPEIALLNFTGPSRCSSQQSVGACHAATQHSECTCFCWKLNNNALLSFDN